MIVGSIKENIELEKRISLTPETAKNIIGLGLKVCIEKNYALHLGIDDKEYKDVGTEIKSTPTEIYNASNLIIKVNCLPAYNLIGLIMIVGKFLIIYQKIKKRFYQDLKICPKTFSKS